MRAAQHDLERSLESDPPLTKAQQDEVYRLSQDFPRVWNHHDTSTKMQKQLLRLAIIEVIVQRDGAQLAFTIHWSGNA